MVNVDMQTILTIDIGSTNMKAVLHDAGGRVVHIAKRRTLPDYLADRQVEMDAEKLRGMLISLLGESCAYMTTHNLQLIAISVTSQRSSVVP